MKRDTLDQALSELRILMIKRCKSVPTPWAASLVAGTLLCFSIGEGSIGAPGLDVEPEGPTMITEFQLPSNDTGSLRPPTAAVNGIRYIRLYPHGFEPKKMTFIEGPFLLAVDNRSGFVQGEITFRLDKIGVNRTREARLPARKRGWRELVDFSPGTYLLTEVNHPKWACEITVLSR